MKSISKEFSPGIISDAAQKLEMGDVYVAPEAVSLPIENIDRATSCACRAGDDNPYR